MALSRFVLTATVTINWPPTWSEVVGQAPASAITQPAVPASTVAQFNNNPEDVVVTVSGGTVTAISVNGTASGLTSGAVVVPAGGTIAITYSAAPAWTWASLAAAGPSPSTTTVTSAGPPGGQAGPLPLVTFIAGTAIYADSSAITAGTPGTGAQQLYQAIGSSNLMAFRDGTDNVGHAALAN